MVRWGRRLVMATCSALVTACQAVPATPAEPTGSGAGCAPARVFVSGQKGYSTFRIPAVVQVPGSGTAGPVLVAFAEGRRESGADHGDVDVVERRSTDGGCTWTALREVAGSGPNTRGNPVPVVDPSGRLVLLTTRNGGATTEADIMSGDAVPADGRRVFVQSSDDAGVTWSRSREITAQVKRPGWRWYATGPGHGIALTTGPHKGRLVVGADHSVTPSPDSGDNGSEPRWYAGHSLLSDDGGRTWRIGYVDAAGDGRVNVNETAVAQLPDGRVYFNARDQKGTDRGSRAHAWSDDGGTTLQAPFRTVPGITAPSVEGSLLQTWDGRGSGPLLLAAPGDPRDRLGMTVRASLDGGVTWSAGYRLTKARAAYSDLVQIDSEHVGLLYETGSVTPYDTVTFTRLTIASLLR